VLAYAIQRVEIRHFMYAWIRLHRVAELSPFWKWLARAGAPIAAILIPAAFFLSVASPTATQSKGLINLGYLGALFLAAAILCLEARTTRMLQAKS
jgi:hypothetical protein